MKKLFTVAGIILCFIVAPMQQIQAQIPILEIIKAGVKKVIKAIDLKIQRLQNKTIWLQNAQKTLENEMSKLKLKEIEDWADKQKQLYAKYFDELSKVKSAIGTYQALKDIISKQRQIVKEYSRAYNLSKQDKNFSAQEIEYMGQVYSGILEESLKNIEQVQIVVTAFATQMTDEKRLYIIHTASDNIDRNLGDLRQFNQQNIRISLQRSKEKHDVDVVKKLYGIE
ncbi:MAG: conjugal transfer protein TraI [Ferruginibacter sp.]|uniref:conjugal transfer protein TraI n=1 Tax=Ferruginibacter sp. TaxID=1940288 RepID=UPI00265A8DD7|nr:conjugal transfer protein TraI [Ferruginibacter sp.]MDB5280675.1 conjugal transfer protein TraI [Ferruginibacter sp.]